MQANQRLKKNCRYKIVIKLRYLCASGKKEKWYVFQNYSSPKDNLILFSVKISSDIYIYVR